MDQENKAITANLVVLRTLTAFLLARDSTLSGMPLNGLHQFLVDEFESMQLEAGLSPAEFEAVAVSALDGVFALAETMRRAMLKPQ